MYSRNSLVLDAIQNCPDIDHDKINHWIANDEIIIDVRELHEYNDGHLAGAVHISRGLLEFEVDRHPMLCDRQQPILLYCQSGGRSALAAKTLRLMGFENVFILRGGIKQLQVTSISPTQH